MAKTIQAAIFLTFAKIYWRKADNYRFDYGTTKENAVLAQSLADQNGWLADHPCKVYVPANPETRKMYIAECMKERTARHEALRTDSASGTQLQVFEALYLDQKTRKLIEPEYFGNSGFRRSSVFEEAQLLRWKDSNIPNEDKIVPMIPAIVQEYKNDLDRILNQQVENALQKRGTKDTTETEKLMTALFMFQQGAKQIALRQLYTGNVGQKLFGICEANRNWPNLRIVERIRLPADDPSNIPIKKLRQDILTKLNNRFDADQLRKAGKPLSDAQMKLEPLALGEAESYFDNLRAPGEPVAKMMSKSDIETLAKNNPVKFFQTAMNIVLENNGGETSRYNVHSEVLNLLKDMVDSGRADLAQSALALANEYPLTFTSVKDAVLNVKDDELSRAIRHATVKVQPKPVPAVVGK